MTRTRHHLALETLLRGLVLCALIAVFLVSSAPVATTADAQTGPQPLEVWGISGGIVPSPKVWKFRQSTSAANNIGSATAASPGLNDTSWATANLRWEAFPGSNVATHFRKTFDLADVGVELYQVVGIRVRLQYDDAAVLYLNGVEVYRTIRGSLDPTYSTYALGANMPWNAYVPFGGYENYYVDIPNVNGTNDCEYNGPTCPTSPYVACCGGPNPPAIPVSLLQQGTNTWGITVWNNSGGGSGDVSVNHVFELLIDETAVPPNSVFINEVMAVNNTAYGVNLDGIPGLEYPDWFELRNTSASPVNLAGWTISDSGASWVFPSVTIPGNGYLVVAANDGNNTTTTPMQTNFKLSSAGDSLKLTNAAGFVADEYAVIPDQFADNSYGRPNNTGPPTYLASYTPWAANSAAGTRYTPILRLFPNRLYNVGESVSHQIDAFDPDGDPLTYQATPLPPGVSLDPSTGLISGTVTAAGSTFTTLRVTDSDGDFATQLAQWIVLAAPIGPAPLVLNEYNAVADDRELLAGSVLGNGGDWFEFVVVQDQLDLRGWKVELYDLKEADGQLRLQTILTFANRIELARIPSGTIITISEDLPDDLSFDAINDWNINLGVDNNGNGAFFVPAGTAGVFNSTRSGQTVLIRNAAGQIVTPLSGETEAWDKANGGVSGGEVMQLCVNPTIGMTLNPVADYQDVGAVSTFGQPSQCVYPDPLNPAVTITFNQNLTPLRSAASLGAGSGDVNCDLAMTLVDALLVAQYAVGSASDGGPCLLDQGGPGFEMYASAGDLDRNGLTSLVDALIIMQCQVGITNPWCS